MKKVKEIVLTAACLSLFCQPLCVFAADISAGNGDINNDGVTDITDMTLLSLHLIGDITLDKKELIASDVTSDGKINLSDLAHLKRYVSKKETASVPESGIVLSTHLKCISFETPSDAGAQRSTVFDSYEKFADDKCSKQISALIDIDEKFFDENIIVLTSMVSSESEETSISSLSITQNETGINICMNISRYSDSWESTMDANLISHAAVLPRTCLPENKSIRVSSSIPDTDEWQIRIGGTIMNIENGVFTCTSDIGYVSFTLPETGTAFIKKKADEYKTGDKIIFSCESITTGEYPHTANNVSSIGLVSDGATDCGNALITGKVEEIKGSIATIASCYEDVFEIDLSDEHTRYIGITPSEIETGDELIITCSRSVYSNMYTDMKKYVYTVELLTEENIPLEGIENIDADNFIQYNTDGIFELDSVVAIQSWEEFNEYVKLANGQLDILCETVNEKTFDNSVVFLQTACGSSSVNNYITGFRINREDIKEIDNLGHHSYPLDKAKITMETVRVVPNILTSDIEYEVLSAIVPKTKLIDVDLSSIEVQNSNWGYSDLMTLTGEIVSIAGRTILLDSDEKGLIYCSTTTNATKFIDTTPEGLKPGDTIKLVSTSSVIGETWPCQLFGNVLSVTLLEACKD